MNLRPLQDWAVIRKSEPEEKTAGGIIIPDVAKEEPLEGVVVAIGPGRYKIEKGKEKEKKKKFIPTVLKPGQKVIYQKYAERDIELDGKVITLVREEDILGTIEDYGIQERKSHAVEGKKEGPVAVRAKANVPAVRPAALSEKKPSAAGKISPAKKAEAKKKTAPSKASTAQKKTAGNKPTAKKKTAAIKPAKRALAKPAPKKSVSKAGKKAVSSKKKDKAPAKKAVSVQKTTPKKTAPKKPAVKKSVLKKTVKVAAKKTVSKKTTKKIPASTKGRKK